MLQWLKKVVAGYKEIESLVGLIPAAFALFNNHMYSLIPLSPLLHGWASVFTFFGCLVAIGLTVSRIRNKSSSTDLREWLHKQTILWNLLGFGAFGLYLYLLKVFEHHSYSESLSTLFDVAQVGLFVLPFLCWTVGVVALAWAISL